MKCVRRFLRDQRGMEVPTLIMLMAFVGIPLIIALTQFSEDILGILSSAVDRLRPGD
ncbi:Flp family type IVb pilin [Roseibium sp.]|uniref:Flp family type IVb pilin n=1 Tax=Roseibium sp. TaxID=1936156 RepID=UPI003BB06DE0